MKIIKNPVFMFILGVVTCTITTVLASSLIASNISYTPQDKTWGVDNVGAAIDSLKLSKTSDNYSTEERVVGTWIDGKPLYQKTINTGTFSNASGSKTIAHNISNLERVVNTFGFARNSNSGASIPLPMQQKNMEIGVWSNSSVIYIEWDGDRSAITETYVTLQYTKTTD